MAKYSLKLWVSRGLIGIVTFLNLQAAFLFLVFPSHYAPSFELSGVEGDAMIRGIGLLFLMWNVPYLVALIHPLKHFVSLVEAVLMQFIGVTGESIILLTLPGYHPIIRESVLRFIYFDGGGLVLLVIALGLAIILRRNDLNLVQYKE